MELWVRSQDKSMLLKVERLGISFNTRTDLDRYEIEADDYPIGDYKTKERAVEILNEIQSKLKGTFLMKMKDEKYSKYIEDGKKYLEDLNGIGVVTGDRCFDIEPINKDIYVYEMPEK